MPANQADWRQLYPFRSRFFDLDGLRYHYLDEGGGVPLLMVHGNPTWSFYWRNLVLAFREDYRVIVPDHLGCGLSDKPQRYPYRLANHTANLVKLIEHLGLREATLLAHDWGGAIGLGAALETSCFSRLILFNTAAFPPPFVPLRIRCCRFPLIGTLAIRQYNLFARAALTMAVEKPATITPAVAAGLLAPYDSWRNRVAIHRFVRDIPFTPWHPSWTTLAQLESNLPTLQHLPAQLIWGMRDWCFRPECLERLRAMFSEADVHQLEDAGHYVIEEAHQHIIPLVADFLRRTR